MKNKLIINLIAAMLTAAVMSGCDIIQQDLKETNENTETADFAFETVSEDSSTPEISSTVDPEIPVFYLTGSDVISVLSEPNGEFTSSLPCGAAVYADSADSGEYVFVTSSDKQTSGYVLGAYITNDKQSVTSGLTANAAESGANVYTAADSGETLETLYGGESVTILAKTPGGYWRVLTNIGNIGYVSVTELDSSSLSSEADISIVSERENVSSDTVIEETQSRASSGSVSETSSISEKSTKNGDPDDVLASAVNTAVSEAGGSWAAAYIDLTTGESSAVYSSPMQAASLIKLFIMGAVYERYDTYSEAEPDIDTLLYSMITVSDNDAANKLVSILGSGNSDAGKNAVTRYSNSHGWNSTSMGRLLLESTENGDNYTSVYDCADFLAKAYNGELAHSSDMLRLLGDQTRTNKIPAGVPVRTANKTGELDAVQNDAAIVYADNPYVLCVMSENVSSSSAVDAIVDISSSVYDELS